MFLSFEMLVPEPDVVEAQVAVPEHSHPGESQSNGLVERAVRSVKDQVRTLRPALQKRVGCRIPAGHPIITWMVKHAGELISEYQLNRDGQTAYHNVFGKPCKDVIVEFGEEVHYRVSEVDTGSLDGRWASERPQASSRATRWNGSPLKTDGAKMPWKQSLALHGAHSRQRVTPGLHVLPPLPADQQLRDQSRPREPEVRAPLRPRISKHDAGC